MVWLALAVAAALAVAGVAAEESTDDRTPFPTPACGFAVQMAYLQDFSASFEDDKVVTGQQLIAILESIDDRYPESRFGLGTFVDKPLMNFGYPYMGPWFEGDWCLNVTHPMDNDLDPQTLVQQFFEFSADGGGNDWPENQLGAMLDIAQGPLIGWDDSPNSPEGRPYIQLLVVSTDSLYHIAGEGAASPHELYPNNADGETVCDEEDYPAISQVSAALKEKNIYTVFLVGTENAEDLKAPYEELLVALDVPGGVYEIEEGTEGLLEGFRQMFEDIERVYCRQTLDVVFTQDVTASYDNDRPNFLARMDAVTAGLAETYAGSRFGFTTFGDKPLYPFGHGGSGDYCFRVERELTEDRQSVVDAAAAVQLTSGLDWRESQLDAIISSVAHERINYRQGDFIDGVALIRVVAMATDAGYHRQGDEAAEGYSLLPHNGGPLDDARCVGQEYPTVVQMAEALSEEDVYPVFLPTSDIAVIYRQLAEQLSAYGITSLVIELDDFGGDLAAAVKYGVEQVVAKVQARRVTDKFQSRMRLEAAAI